MVKTELGLGDVSREVGARVGLNADLGMVEPRLQPLGTSAPCPPLGWVRREAVGGAVRQELGCQPGAAFSLCSVPVCWGHSQPGRRHCRG